MRPAARLVPLVLLAAIPLAACGGDDDDGAGGGSGGFAEMLATVPADALDGEAPILQYVDMQLVWERLGVADGTAEEKFDALASSSQVDRYSLVPRLFEQQAALTEEARQEVGFDVTDVQREIAVDDPPGGLRILDVAVAPEVIDEATASDPTWSDRRQEVEYDDATYLDWTADGDELAQDLDRLTPMRPLGIGGQLAVSERGEGSRVVRTKQTALMEDVLSTADDESGSAAADGPLATVDEALEGEVVQALGVIGAISGVPTRLSPEQAERFESGEGTIGTYDAIVLADVLTDGETSTEVLIVHDSEDAAAANVAAVESLVADGTTMSGVPVSDVVGAAEVEQDGTIVRVSVEPGHFAAIVNGIVARDLFVTR